MVVAVSYQSIKRKLHRDVVSIRRDLTLEERAFTRGLAPALPPAQDTEGKSPLGVRADDKGSI
tara:strand:- start:1447 stop:1635 length:189 start_codon:yes stop_codon:yes gene_type:complete